MSFSIQSLIRMIVALAIVSNLIAIGVSRLAPPPPVYRYPEPVETASINGYHFRPKIAGVSLLNARDGSCRPIVLHDPDRRLDHPSLSPWVDTAGERQVVGRWSARSGVPETDEASPGTTLARFRFPSGELIDSVPTRLVPIAPPTWFPGTRARVLFVAGDGRLYRFDFESEAGEDLDPTRADRRPIPITWDRSILPGDGSVMFADVSWPTAPAPNEMILATLSVRTVETGEPHYGPEEIWWLRLDPTATRVVEAGPLLGTGAGHEIASARNPLLTLDADRTPTLLFASRDAETGPWRLRATPLTIDRATRIPSARVADSRVLFEEVVPNSVAVTADRRWVAGARRSAGEGVRILRVPFSGPTELAGRTGP